jgi:hypothetical protein
MIVNGWLPDAHRWPLRLSLRAVNLDIFDPQRRFVAVAAERIQDLPDGVVDLLGAGRLVAPLQCGGCPGFRRCESGIVSGSGL